MVFKCLPSHHSVMSHPQAMMPKRVRPKSAICSTSMIAACCNTAGLGHRSRSVIAVCVPTQIFNASSVAGRSVKMALLSN